MCVLFVRSACCLRLFAACRRLPFHLPLFPPSPCVNICNNYLVSTDPRLVKNDAAALKVSVALSHPRGRFISFSIVSIGAVFLICLAVINRTGTGYKVISVVYILVTVTRILVIILCSRSMIQMIDKSMARHAAKQRADIGCSRGATCPIAMDPKLTGAKKTILSALFFCINLTSVASTVLICALSTEYGYDNPIVFLATPLAFGPMIALMFHIQLHSKRNRSPARQPTLSMFSDRLGSPNGGGGSKGSTNTPTRTTIKSTGGVKTSSSVLPMETTPAEEAPLFASKGNETLEAGGEVKGENGA